MRSAGLALALGAALLLLWGRGQGADEAVQGRIIAQELDPRRQGYTVLRVHGSAYEMGRAHGTLLADDILKGLEELRRLLGTVPGLLARTRSLIADTQWGPAGIEDEIRGMVEGVRSRRRDAEIDALDVKLMNTYSDWGYGLACRSHACWGGYVEPPVKMLASRVLQFMAPIPTAKHHVLCAWDSSDSGRVDWVNLGWPGSVTVVTAVNEHGTLVALHDHESRSGAIPTEGTRICRSVAARMLISAEGRGPLGAEGLFALLKGQPSMTGGFIPVLAPEGRAGVISHERDGGHHHLRRPHPDFLGGQAIIVTNDETDGQGTPPGGKRYGKFYQRRRPLSLAEHFNITEDGLHKLSIGYRGPRDLTIWAQGQTSAQTPVLKYDWRELFPPP